MADSVHKNSFTKIALLIIGVFVTAVVIIIAVNVGKQTPSVVTVVNAPDTNTTTNTVAPVEPVYSSRIYASTGTVTEKQGNVMTVRGNIHIDNVLTERIFTVEVTPATIYTVINQNTGISSNSNFGSIVVGDTITFRSEENLVEDTTVVATIVDKLIN